MIKHSIMGKTTFYSVADRLMRYVQVDTTSDPDSISFPSTLRQLDLSRILADELKGLGVADVVLNEKGYVIARIPSNMAESVPVICFCSHVDTSSDCSGTDVRPILHENYSGADIVLPDDVNQVLRVSEHPYLSSHIGKSIITASGKTLLGADDKAGIAIIMNTIEHLLHDPSIPHGQLVILFTPDEETGRGTEFLKVEEIGADFAYTLDGGELGTYEEETFNADELTITIAGVSAHPGYAKGKMINAIKVAADLLEKISAQLPAPEHTDLREGFVHPHTISGTAESAVIRLLLRDFDVAALKKQAQQIEQLSIEVSSQWGVKCQLQQKEQYRSMKLFVDQFPQIKEKTAIAYSRAGVQLQLVPVRGGTDGSRLSHMGLPCTNIFTGMQSIHSRHEWVGVSDMERAVDVLVELVQVWAGR